MSDINFLVVDDDPSVIANVKALLLKAFPDAGLETAATIEKAGEILQKNNIKIIICDYLLPGGIDGLKFCQKLRSINKYKSIYFILFTAYNDKELRTRSLNLCVDDFINKPLENEEFLSRIKAAVRIVQLQLQREEENKLLTELAQALEKQINDTKSLVVRMLSIRFPVLADISIKIAKAASWIAKRMGNFMDDEIDDIEFAGNLVYIGKFCLPESLITVPVMKEGVPCDELCTQVPIKAKEILSDIATLSNVKEYLYSVYENFDGSGFPAKLQSWQIPLQSRILRVAIDYYEFVYLLKIEPKEALEKIKSNSRRLYDPKVTVFLEQYLYESGEIVSEFNVKPVQLQDLKEGMIVARDVVTYSGIKLLPAGAQLKEKTIQMLISHNTTDPIVGYIYVRT